MARIYTVLDCTVTFSGVCCVTHYVAATNEERVKRVLLRSNILPDISRQIFISLALDDPRNPALLQRPVDRLLVSSLTHAEFARWIREDVTNEIGASFIEWKL